MRTRKKINIIFNQTLYNPLILFWSLIHKEYDKNENEDFDFYNKLYSYIDKNKINKNVINSLKPFIKISKIFIKHNNILMNNPKYPFNKRRLNAIKKILLIKYKRKIIFVFPDKNKKYTHAINGIANTNFIYFLKKFVENWNKYQNSFKIKINNSDSFKEKEYIKYFENYYDSLK